MAASLDRISIDTKHQHEKRQAYTDPNSFPLKVNTRVILHEIVCLTNFRIRKVRTSRERIHNTVTGFAFSKQMFGNVKGSCKILLKTFVL